MFRFAFFTEQGTGEEMKQADLSSQCNGSNTSFTVPENYKAGSLRVYYNGVRQVTGETFSEHNSNTFTTTGFAPEAGAFLTIDYTPQS